jgi:hypothetical protein
MPVAPVKVAKGAPAATIDEQADALEKQIEAVRAKRAAQEEELELSRLNQDNEVDWNISDQRISGTQLGASRSINREIRTAYLAGDFMGLLDTLKKVSPSTAFGHIVDRVIAKATTMQKQGTKFELGHAVSDNAWGTVRHYPARGSIPSTWEIGLHEVGGVNTITALHEVVHVVTIEALKTNRVLKKEAVELLEVVRKNAEKFYNSPQFKTYEGEVPKVISESHLRSNNSLENIKELVAWGMTNPEFQRFLQSIPYKQGNAWDSFVVLIKKSLGLNRMDTALDEVIRIFNVATDGATTAPAKMPEAVPYLI